MFCVDNMKYTCLFDVIKRTYVEGCNGPEYFPYGHKAVLRGRIDIQDCENELFQPYTFSTYSQSDCVFKKSNCTEEGQIYVNNGTTRRDKFCSCKKGFKFINNQTILHCNPFMDDCTCCNRNISGTGKSLGTRKKRAISSTNNIVGNSQESTETHDIDIRIVNFPFGMENKIPPTIVICFILCCLFILFILMIIDKTENLDKITSDFVSHCFQIFEKDKSDTNLSKNHDAKAKSGKSPVTPEVIIIGKEDMPSGDRKKKGTTEIESKLSDENAKAKAKIGCVIQVKKIEDKEREETLNVRVNTPCNKDITDKDEGTDGWKSIMNGIKPINCSPMNAHTIKYNIIQEKKENDKESVIDKDLAFNNTCVHERLNNKTSKQNTYYKNNSTAVDETLRARTSASKGTVENITFINSPDQNKNEKTENAKLNIPVESKNHPNATEIYNSHPVNGIANENAIMPSKFMDGKEKYENLNAQLNIPGSDGATNKEKAEENRKIPDQQETDVKEFYLLGNSPLVTACKAGDIEMVKIALQNKTDVNQVDSSGNSPLIIACIRDDEEMVNILLQHKADTNQRNTFGEFPLYIACHRENFKIMKILLRSNTNINQTEENMRSTLSVACVAGNNRIVEFILENKADVNQCDMYGESPLYIACDMGHIPMVKNLLRHNANVNQSNFLGTSPLSIASYRGDLKMVRTLLQYNANVNHHDTFGESPLFKAYDRGHFEVVQLLLMNSADVNKCCRSDHLLRTFPKQISTLRNVIGINRRNEKRSKLPTDANYTNIVSILPASKAEIEQCNAAGKCVLYLACTRGYTEILKIMLSNMRSSGSREFCKGSKADKLYNQILLDFFMRTSPFESSYRNRYETIVKILFNMPCSDQNMMCTLFQHNKLVNLTDEDNTIQTPWFLSKELAYKVAGKKHMNILSKCILESDKDSEESLILLFFSEMKKWSSTLADILSNQITFGSSSTDCGEFWVNIWNYFSPETRRLVQIMNYILSPLVTLHDNTRHSFKDVFGTHILFPRWSNNYYQHTLQTERYQRMFLYEKTDFHDILLPNVHVSKEVYEMAIEGTVQRKSQLLNRSYSVKRGLDLHKKNKRLLHLNDHFT